MRKELLMAVLITAVTVCPGQVSVRTPTFSFGKPGLGVRGEFLGENGTTWLNANSRGTITLTLSNSGTATARGAVLTLSPDPQLSDLQIVRRDSLGDIKPGEIRTEAIAVSAPGDAQSRKGAVAIAVRADPGPVFAETRVEIAVREGLIPRLDIRFAQEGGAVVRAGEVSKIKARVQNTGTGEARGVSATFLKAGEEAGIAEIGKTVPLGTIAPGSSMELSLTLRPGLSAAGPAAFVVSLDEERPRFSVSETLSVRVTPQGTGAEEAGFAALKRGEYSRAIASLEKVVAAGNPSKEIYFGLGFSYFKNRNRERCLANMQKSSDLGSNEAKAWLKDNTTSAEIITVSYKQIDFDPFEGDTPPVGLGVLRFPDSLKRDTPLTEKIYAALKAKNETFRIFPYSTIKSEQDSRRRISPGQSDRRMLSELARDLSMNYVVAGIARDPLGSAFSMQLIRCGNGATVLTQEFRSSRNSTAIDDAVMFILKGKVPVYSGSRTVEVKIP